VSVQWEVNKKRAMNVVTALLYHVVLVVNVLSLDRPNLVRIQSN